MKISNILFAIFISSIIFISGCKKDDNGSPDTTTTTTVVVRKNTIDSTIYFKATVSGIDFKLYSDTSYSYALGDSALAIPKGVEYRPFAIVVQKSKAALVLKNSGGITLIFDTTKVLLDDARRNLIKLQSYKYGRIASDSSGKALNGISGARIFFYDASGMKWATDKGTRDQTGSIFTVTEISDSVVDGSYKKIKALFSCKLYDDLGHSMILTNGSFSCRIIN